MIQFLCQCQQIGELKSKSQQPEPLNLTLQTWELANTSIHLLTFQLGSHWITLYNFEGSLMVMSYLPIPLLKLSLDNKRNVKLLISNLHLLSFTFNLCGWVFDLNCSLILNQFTIMILQFLWFCPKVSI